TEFGVIFSMVQDVEERCTPLQRNMDELAKKLSFLSFGIIGVICLIGVLQSRSWLEMFTIAVSLAVAAIPEGLPIVTTVMLALGVLRMLKHKAIVKKLHLVEALGSVSVICSDKSGTLTQNVQTVTELYSVNEIVRIDPSSPAPPACVSPALKTMVEIGAICNNASATRNEEGVFSGQATDVALLNVVSVFNMADPRLHPPPAHRPQRTRSRPCSRCGHFFLAMRLMIHKVFILNVLLRLIFDRSTITGLAAEVDALRNVDFGLADAAPDAATPKEAKKAAAPAVEYGLEGYSVSSVYSSCTTCSFSGCRRVFVSCKSRMCGYSLKSSMAILIERLTTIK
ncbi:hypothetical protein EWM64_g4957, partial [Hericium alpestre]